MTDRERVHLHAKAYRDAALAESVRGHAMTGKALLPRIINRNAADTVALHPEFAPYWKQRSWRGKRIWQSSPD